MHVDEFISLALLQDDPIVLVRMPFTTPNLLYPMFISARTVFNLHGSTTAFKD